MYVVFGGFLTTFFFFFTGQDSQNIYIFLYALKDVFYCTNHVGMINPNQSAGASGAAKTTKTYSDELAAKRSQWFTNNRLERTNTTVTKTDSTTNNPSKTDYFINTDLNHKVNGLDLFFVVIELFKKSCLLMLLLFLFQITYRDVRNPWHQTEFTDSLYNLNRIDDVHSHASQYSSNSRQQATASYYNTNSTTNGESWIFKKEETLLQSRLGNRPVFFFFCVSIESLNVNECGHINLY